MLLTVPLVVPFVLEVLLSPLSLFLYLAKIDSKLYLDVPGPLDSSSFFVPLNLEVVPLVLLELLLLVA